MLPLTHPSQAKIQVQDKIKTSDKKICSNDELQENMVPPSSH